VYVAALAKGELYRSHDGGRTWASLAQDSVAIPLAYLTEWDKWGAMGHWIDGSLFWTAENMQGLWTLPRTMLDAQNCAVRAPSGRQAQLLCAWGLMAVRSDLQTMPLPWLALRLWVWQATTWLRGTAGAAELGVTIAVGLALAAFAGWTYAKVARPWGMPLWAAWFAPARVERFARPGALEAAWPAWEKQVRAELAEFDDVRPVDLVDIPATFRSYALRRYAEVVAPQEWLEASRGRLRVLPQARTCAWRDAAHAAHAAHAGHAGPGSVAERDGQAGPAADARAPVLAEALRVNSGAAQVVPGARIYLTEPLALAGAAPGRVQLMFLEAAWVETFRALVSVQQRNPDDLALLVLPPDIAKTAELCQALVRSLRSGSFIVLGGDEVARLLLAREPRQVLAQLRQEQV
jgi:hypothetical protein